ncbi:AMP-binding protein, partial [Luedemannella flava]|uniref:AMP-binding protein n=1 Tax=Luedemannella flava TaxID=349316 RepID=UPI0031D9A461
AAGPRRGVALIDDAGPQTRADLLSAARRLASGAQTLWGVRPGARVGVACAAHRGFVTATAGLGLLGADAVLIPPDLPAAPLADLLAAQRVTALIHDGQVTDAPCPSLPWADLVAAAGAAPATTTDGAPVGGGGATRSRRGGRLVVLTSGTTGAPRGVIRRLSARTLLGPVSTHLRHVALRPGVPLMVAAPPHHGYGLTYLAAALGLGARVVLAARLDPAATWAALAEHGAGLLVALPTQLSRLCDQSGEPPASLRAVVTGAAPLSPELTARLLDRFGDRVFNLYGSTEAGWAAIATPADLRAVPGTVGRAPRGIALTVRGPAGAVLPPGQVGEVHVAGWAAPGNAVATGDLGRFDRAGRLTLVGRVDDMIISGGENVFPGAVRDMLAGHPRVRDAVVEPVADPEFGQLLRARVRLRDGSPAGVEAELRAWLRERLPPPQRPREILIEQHPCDEM